MPSGVYDRTDLKPNSGTFKKGLIPWNKGKHPEYVQGKNHPMFGVKRFGNNNPNWSGGRHYHKNGYIWVVTPNHPHRDKDNRVLEHRLVVEKEIGRYLLSKEAVHHRGGKDDNRPCMLMAFVSNAAHMRFEHGSEVKDEEIIFDGRKQCK